MAKASLTKKQANIERYLKKIEQELDAVPAKATEYFKYDAPTPVKSGNARRNTSLKNNKEIHANYPYAARLNDGYSKQAPSGMAKPTIEYIQQLVRKIFKGTI